MKCPKCGYLGFERVERCRNCGYDFSLTESYDLPEIQIREDSAGGQAFKDLAIDRSLNPVTPAHSALPHIAPAYSAPAGELPFGHTLDDRPLIIRASPPRTPLSVRRATPEVQRLRPPARTPMLDLAGEAEPHGAAGHGQLEEWPSEPAEDGQLETAAMSSRLAAAAIDLVILAAIDAVVIYFTMQICGLTFEDFSILPKGPLLAFLLVQNGGYLVAFTAGGQTLGKMAAGIMVVPASDAPLDLGHSILRTLVWAALVVPAGLGLLTTLLSRDRRGLHDRFAGTRVVRATL